MGSREETMAIKVWLLVLSMAALTLAFDATIIQTQGPGHSSTEVVLNLGSQGQPIQDMKPLMAHMQRLAAHMNNAFGGNPLDLDSLFRDTVNHFHAMQQALLGAHPPPQIDHHRSLMEHIAHRPQCPKVAVAAACHCLLHQCLHQVLPQIQPTEHPTESPTEAVDDSQHDRYDRQPRYR